MKLTIIIERPALEGRVLRIEKQLDLNRLNRMRLAPKLVWNEIEELENILVGNCKSRKPSKTP